MFDNNLALSNYMLNKLNEHLMQAFFLSFVIKNENQNQNDKVPLLTNLKTLQLPDFLHHLFIINLILWNLYYIHVNVGGVN